MKCINCGNHVDKTTNFCDRCGNKINRLLYVRMIILGLLATAIPFIVLKITDEDIGFVYMFAAYAICVLIVEFTLKTSTRKEGIICSIVSPLIQFVLMMLLAMFDVSATGDVKGVLVIGIMILELPYVPILFVINIIINLIFGKKEKKL